MVKELNKDNEKETIIYDDMLEPSLNWNIKTNTLTALKDCRVCISIVEVKIFNEEKKDE